jgi:hypothetical protein
LRIQRAVRILQVGYRAQYLRDWIYGSLLRPALQSIHASAWRSSQQFSVGASKHIESYDGG